MMMMPRMKTATPTSSLRSSENPTNRTAPKKSALGDLPLSDAKIKAQFANLAGTVLAGSPADFGKLIAEETGKWAKVVRFSGAKAE